MGGGACVVIINGGRLQGAAQELISTAQASCALVEYLKLDPDEHFNDDDAKPIEQFHSRASATIAQLNADLLKLNSDLAAKYNR